MKRDPMATLETLRAMVNAPTAEERMRIYRLNNPVDFLADLFGGFGTVPK